MNKKNIYIPIGNSCGIAWQLRKSDGNEAFPLDWFQLPKMNTIFKILEDNFEHLTDTDNLSFWKYSDKFFIDSKPGVPSALFKNTKYKIKFCHDFTKEDLSELSDVKDKYDRRIDRFYESIKSDNKIIFIRDDVYSNVIQEDFEKFINIIKTINPDIDISLIVIVNNPNNLEFIFKDTENITYYNDIEKYTDWKRENLDWNKIFNIN